MGNMLKYLLCVFATLLASVAGAQVDDQYGAGTNTQLPGYDAQTNPNRVGIVSVSMHKNAMTVHLDGEAVGKHFNYCHIDANGSLHRQAFNYQNAAFVVFVELVATENVLDIYLDDVLIQTFTDWCKEAQE